jgi:hypothetical protein
VDPHVVHVDFQPALSDIIHEDVVHEGLERGRGVGETEEHDSGFEESKWVDEGGLPLVFLSKADVVVSPTDVELGEQIRVFHFVDQSSGVW